MLSDRSKAILSSMLLLVFMLLMIFAAEGIVRVRQYLKYGTFSVVSQLQMDEKTGLQIPKPGFRTGSISINSRGFRGPEIEMPKPRNRLRIGFIGASTTYCAEVSSNELVWTELVSRKLESLFPRLSIDYINGGVAGYSTANSLINLEQRVLPLEPDIVIIYHATNDLSGETRELAQRAGILRTTLAAEESWLSEYSLLWLLVEKNLALMSIQNSAQIGKITLIPEELGAEFRENLQKLVHTAADNGAKLVALTTFSIHLRHDMTPDEQEAAMASALYYMPYLSPSGILAGFDRYNQIIREVAAETGALLIEGENNIPGDPVHFRDSVHFTDAGSRAQAARIVDALAASREFQEIALSKRQEASAVQ